MNAAVIFDNLEQKCNRNDHILPTNEWQVRPLTKLDPDIQPEAWEQAVECANGKVPSHRIVKDAVQRIMERTQVPNTYQIGEICQILAKDNLELRGKDGCWVIVSAVNDFSCTVKMWNSEYAVGLQHLKSFNYLPAECEQMQVICDRITRVYSSGLEESVQKFLESLGKLKRVYLTGLEEKVLSVLESEIRV
ncbi:Site-specific DNA-cytosine methylase (plasmid) [Nostoc flagelliforme CCNUN1]|uniref:Site-specific DNA-cytosine methylase n=2 Tax=Nostoc flagelliforme TaxID=1306274 RepID=A0A2K8T5V9_9NOSO|nr:Site-specific DNA-cytosine methylase [Nostoc flagelliforme CCNUN1]